MDQLVDVTLRDRVHAERLEVEATGLLVEQAQHHPLAVARRNGRDAHVDRATRDAQRNAAVLWQPLLGDIEARHDLDARDDQRRDGALGLQYLAQHAVHAEADHEPVLERLDVDVRGILLHRLGEQRVDEADDRGLVLALEQVGRLRDFLGEVGEVGFLLEAAHGVHRRARAALVGLSEQEFETVRVDALDDQGPPQVPPHLRDRQRGGVPAHDHVGAVLRQAAHQDAAALRECERQGAGWFRDPPSRGQDVFAGGGRVHGCRPCPGGVGTGVSPNGVVGSGSTGAGAGAGGGSLRVGFTYSGVTSCSSEGSVG